MVETQTTKLDCDEVSRDIRFCISRDHNQTYIGYATKNLVALRRIVLKLLKLDPSDTHSLPETPPCHELGELVLGVNHRKKSREDIFHHVTVDIC